MLIAQPSYRRALRATRPGHKNCHIDAHLHRDQGCIPWLGLLCVGPSSGRYLPSVMPVGCCCWYLKYCFSYQPTLLGSVVILPLAGSSTVSRYLCYCASAVEDSIVCHFFGLSLSTLRSMSCCSCTLLFQCLVSSALIWAICMQYIWRRTATCSFCCSGWGHVTNTTSRLVGMINDHCRIVAWLGFTGVSLPVVLCELVCEHVCVEWDGWLEVL
jgi:hypothetical protein